MMWSQIVTTSQKHRRADSLPIAFTEQGVAMLSSVLRSERAVAVNIAIMRTFVQLRRLMDSNAHLARKIICSSPLLKETSSPLGPGPLTDTQSGHGPVVAQLLGLDVGLRRHHPRRPDSGRLQNLLCPHQTDRTDRRIPKLNSRFAVSLLSLESPRDFLVGHNYVIAIESHSS
jgi:hypothetical protein